MKKTLLTLLLLLITFSYAKEDPKRFYNSDITINKIGKVLEVIFETEKMKPNVVLKRLGEKSKFSLDFDATEDGLIVNFKEYKQGAYMLTIDAEFKNEDILVYVNDIAIKIIDRRTIMKPMFQFKDNKFRVIVHEQETPIDILVESLSGNILYKGKYSSEGLSKKIFKINDKLDKYVVTLKYKRKVFSKTLYTS